jgi:hypothetical protein
MIDRDAARALCRTGDGNGARRVRRYSARPLQLDCGMLTVNNHTSSDWNNVEI